MTERQITAAAFIAGGAMFHFLPEMTMALVLGVMGNWLYSFMQPMNGDKKK